MRARISGIAAAVLACSLVALLSGCTEPQSQIDIKNVVKELDAGSISKVVCTQEFGPGVDRLYTNVTAISGTDQSDVVIARLETLGFDEDPNQSDPGDVSMYTSGRKIRAQVRAYSGDQEEVNFGGGTCKIPAEGLTEIEFT